MTMQRIHNMNQENTEVIGISERIFTEENPIHRYEIAVENKHLLVHNIAPVFKSDADRRRRMSEISRILNEIFQKYS